MATTKYCLQEVHIDVARNATDDFNLFHDKAHWQEITDNPFGGPIALGFQLTCFIEDYFHRFRQESGEAELVTKHAMNFSNYQVNFAGVVRPGDTLELHAKPTKHKLNGQHKLNNRFVLKNQNGIVLLGFKSESEFAEYGTSELPPLPMDLKSVRDRSVLEESGYFYKRKYSTNSNAKNFLTGSHVDQSRYFDELENKIHFPESYCTALTSCALLEQGHMNNHDFKRAPMVYTAHKFSVNRKNIDALRSDQMIHLLVSPPIKEENGLVKHICFGLDESHDVLYQGEIVMAPLASILH